MTSRVHWSFYNLSSNKKTAGKKECLDDVQAFVLNSKMHKSNLVGEIPNGMSIKAGLIRAQGGESEQDWGVAGVGRLTCVSID